MKKIPFILASAISVLPALSLSALDFRLPAEPSATAVPAAPPASRDADAMKAEYDDLYSALRVYSDVAFISPQDSPAFREAAAYGQYLRARLEGVARDIRGASGAQYYGKPGPRAGGEVSFRVFSELQEIFGFSGSQEPRATEARGVPVKQGYCQINYVKNNVPFLVQYDGFLKKGEVILTFDDGPGPLTEEVSAAMKAAGAPSVFFVLGSKLGPNGKDLLKLEAADGHEAAVHGYNHATAAGKPFTALSKDETLKQLGGVRDTITAVIGRKPVFFRPPYGIISPEVLKAIDSDLGLVPVGWTVDTLDWSTKDPDELFRKTVSLIEQRGKGIVLMHDIHPQSRTAVKRLVKWLAENGYKVVAPERMAQAYRGE